MIAEVDDILNGQAAEAAGLVRLDQARWRKLRDRVIDEVAAGKTLGELTPPGVGSELFEIWLKKPESGALESWRVGQKPRTVLIAEALEGVFMELDQNAEIRLNRCPKRVETTVTRALIEAAETARQLCEWVDFAAPPGTGKTEAKQEYIARIRKQEGFFCPVWSVELDEMCVSPRAALNLIAREVLGEHATREKNDFLLNQAVIDATYGRHGLLLIDEGQHLADATKKMGIPTVNLLRRFVDRGCFGVLYMGNGEMYRRLLSGKGAYTQLISRMQDFRVEVAPYSANQSAKEPALSRDDVLSVAAAWGVQGVAEIAYCLKAAALPGSLRSMTNIIRSALVRFGDLSVGSLQQIRRL